MDSRTNDLDLRHVICLRRPARPAGFALLLISATLVLAGSSTLSGQTGSAAVAQFRAAAASYDAADYPQAQRQLEQLLPRFLKSFEVHELLGLTYAAESRQQDALEQLEVATTLKPDSALARTNYGTALSRAAQMDRAEVEFEKATELDPNSYSAVRNLAMIYLSSNRIDRAVPLLERCRELDPAAYDNGYDLALAYLLAGKSEQARHQAEALLGQKNAGEVHAVLGRIDEKEGKFVEAANEFATAARLDPSEDNLFTWASELLLHRTYEPAITVFENAVQRYPAAARLRIGLGMALYSRGEYDKSIQSLLAAIDISPQDPRCYLFLSKAYLSSPKQADDVIGRFRRYTELEPRNGRAWYYYALALWKGRRSEDSPVDYATVESLLGKSLSLDEGNSDAHLQLGILYSEQHEYAKALPEYQRALELNASLPDAHYRLGQYYVHAGEKQKAQGEFDLYKQLQAQHQAEVDKERAEVQQFVVSNNTSPAKP